MEIPSEAPISGAFHQEKASDAESSRPPSDGGVPASGRRAAFRDVKRQLSDEELKSSGVQRLLLDMLEQADEALGSLQPYVERFHAADKSVAVMTERLRRNTTLEVFFGVGVGLGGAIIGLAPFFWTQSPQYGQVTAIIGFLLAVGATV
ncbi:MAG TPA: hypothetical protein VMZ06_12995, partial [Candidatus Bathyarchaeia archaeon]|nr:hypothetical protein [Candidatus Bathyarchaeia archaeon]